MALGRGDWYVASGTVRPQTPEQFTCMLSMRRSVQAVSSEYCLCATLDVPFPHYDEAGAKSQENCPGPVSTPVDDAVVGADRSEE